jgi:acetoin utilization deacetylase AcuC-like enzyme
MSNKINTRGKTMKVVFRNEFYQVYTSDPAAEAGRIEAIINVIKPYSEFIEADPASEEELRAVHSQSHIEWVRRKNLYDISALAAGATIQAARIGLTEPCFAVVRPPGHHASEDSAWGFCYFNNIVVAIETLKRENKIQSAYILDFDMHYGDGTVNLLGTKEYVTICNADQHHRENLMAEIKREMEICEADMIGVSAGFDNHLKDWGGVLRTGDYYEIGQLVRAAALRNNGGCFAVLEGGYNHQFLGHCVKAFMDGMAGK